MPTGLEALRSLDQAGPRRCGSTLAQMRRRSGLRRRRRHRRSDRVPRHRPDRRERHDRTGYDAVTATYADADIVVAGDVTEEQLEEVRALPDVQAANSSPIGIEIRKAARAAGRLMLPTADDPRLSSLVVEDGTDAHGDRRDRACPATAEAFGVKVGDHVQVRWTTSAGQTPAPDATASTEPSEEVWRTVDDDVVVTGYRDRSCVRVVAERRRRSGHAPTTSCAGATPARSRSSPRTPSWRPGPASAPRRCGAPSAWSSPSAEALTRDEAAESIAAFFDGRARPGRRSSRVRGGAARRRPRHRQHVQVLVAQRTRTLALLRCVGAARELRRSVLVEAAILGPSLGRRTRPRARARPGCPLRAGNLDLGVPLPSTIEVTLRRAAPAAGGHGGHGPGLPGAGPRGHADARRSRRCVRPTPGDRCPRRPRAVRAVAPAHARRRRGHAARDRPVQHGLGDPTLLLGIGALAGGLSFVGVLVGAAFSVPKVVSFVGRALARTGTSARLAAANTVRNPRRTAATSAALLIGATLVAMMSTGAASARVSLAQELDEHYPVDLMVDGTVQGDGASLSGDVTEAVAEVTGVDTVLEMRVAPVLLGDDWVMVVAPVDGSTTAVLRDPGTADGLDDGTLLLPKFLAEQATDETIPVTAYATTWDDSEPAPGGSDVPLRTVPTRPGRDLRPGHSPDPRAARTAGPGRDALGLLDPGADAALVLQDVRAALPDTPAEVSSAGAERASNELVINTLLAIVVGLLGVAVVIALIGVANTLSLSVLERRRESATLRAIGLSRRQLRLMLAVEGMLIAGVGAVLGAGLGLLYGWAGAVITFGEIGDVILVIPWTDLALLLVVALAAGLLASVLPGRAAARTSPVAALAVD